MSIVTAKPYPYTLPAKPPALILIDMQRDFIEAGGFGSALGNDVTPLQKIVPAVRNILDMARRLGLVIIHTREAHQTDLSDCPPANRARGHAPIQIGDAGPMGRL